ncbi:glutamine--fructose-6-phosphate transaminase (isomerizing) [Pseudobutyrivibrio ruminis]|uniref:Glutamine--fructose-6-phosphate aminotransferase [isomerizing] n=1 Tax=Pseudobutyrivibrio ruminis DSM 9787 TaxID=1123011 RepID=A0A285SQ43_9FIRM|nr:glutamine--fructose-6-phosphate transaminase (isomerizing) [Pseudobutyrivibrio ruminis]SOC08267.1 glucosamine--fructose-6-phosphate aminotransferase (isomerizing) [Pseudobutyrivibrio ruminis DSM 9787]
MCGIIGFLGNDALANILDGLELLEYRGYDSAGIAIRRENEGDSQVYKCQGRVSDLRGIVPAEGADFSCGIGHTRWATHGGVCDKNAHPHRSGKVTLVHNGIIENYADLREEYELEDKLVTETDTEVVAALIDKLYDGDPKKTIKRVIKKIKGTFAFVIMFDDKPDTIYAVRNVSPIVATTTDNVTVLSSDPAALFKYSKEYFVLDERIILTANRDGISLEDFDGNPVEPKYTKVDWDVSAPGKQGYPYFMAKEIDEQPTCIRRILSNYLVNNDIEFGFGGTLDDALKNFNRICIVACGTALHAGIMGAQLFKKWTGINVDTEMASEFIYSDTTVGPDTLFIAVSQSGETIDTLEALRKAKEAGALCLAILNVRGSSISRVADYTLYTDAGPEIAVASTKAYTTQMLMFYMLALKSGLVRGTITEEYFEEATSNLRKIPDAMAEVIGQKDAIHKLAKEVITASDLFMIGRGLDYTVLMEGALKLKEISYIHSEAYAAGELKHGPIALISEGTPVIAAVTQTHLISKALSNVKEIRARGANVVLIAKNELKADFSDEYHVIGLPDLDDEYMSFPEIVALQIYSYYVSADKGLDVDKPRNLAKVVTVE